jgi:Rod binding domain-containing protein
MERNGAEEIPILTDVVELRASSGSTGIFPVVTEERAEQTGIQSAEELAALQADLVARALNLTDELLNGAAREIEGVLFERVLDRLRSALPEIVANALREHLNPEEG